MYTRYVTITIPAKQAPIRRRRRRRRRNHSVLSGGLYYAFTVFCILTVCIAMRVSSAEPLSCEPISVAETDVSVKTELTKATMQKTVSDQNDPAELEMTVPAEETGQKTFMDYRAITSITSEQYVLQQDAVTDELGLRELDGRYMVAMGTYYGTVGDIFRIAMENGAVFEVIMGDVKADEHTDATNRHRNGNVLEFIVDGDRISEEVWYHGDVSYAASFLSGQIESITKLFA